jgi:hypothetical protein
MQLEDFNILILVWCNSNVTVGTLTIIYIVYSLYFILFYFILILFLKNH